MNNMDWINYYTGLIISLSTLMLLFSPGDLELKHRDRVIGLILSIPIYGRAMGLW